MITEYTHKAASGGNSSRQYIFDVSIRRVYNCGGFYFCSLNITETVKGYSQTNDQYNRAKSLFSAILELNGKLTELGTKIKRYIRTGVLPKKMPEMWSQGLLWWSSFGTIPKIWVADINLIYDYLKNKSSKDLRSYYQKVANDKSIGNSGYKYTIDKFIQVAQYDNPCTNSVYSLLNTAFFWFEDTVASPVFIGAMAYFGVDPQLVSELMDEVSPGGGTPAPNGGEQEKKKSLGIGITPIILIGIYFLLTKFRKV